VVSGSRPYLDFTTSTASSTCRAYLYMMLAVVGSYYYFHENECLVVTTSCTTGSNSITCTGV